MAADAHVPKIRRCSAHAPHVTERIPQLVHRMLHKAKEERPTMSRSGDGVADHVGISITGDAAEELAISLGSSGSISLAEIRCGQSDPGCSGYKLAGGPRRRRLPSDAGAYPSDPISVPPPVDWAPAGSSPPSRIGCSGGRRGRRRWCGGRSAAHKRGLLRAQAEAIVFHVLDVKTTPPGAAVIRTDSGTPLGERRGLMSTRLAPESFQVSIQFTGYQPNTLTLDNGRDETLELTLVPLPCSQVEPPPTPPPPPPRHHRVVTSPPKTAGSEVRDSVILGSVATRRERPESRPSARSIPRVRLHGRTKIGSRSVFATAC